MHAELRRPSPAERNLDGTSSNGEDVHHSVDEVILPREGVAEERSPTEIIEAHLRILNDKLIACQHQMRETVRHYVAMKRVTTQRALQLRGLVRQVRELCELVGGLEPFDGEDREYSIGPGPAK